MERQKFRSTSTPIEIGAKKKEVLALSLGSLTLLVCCSNFSTLARQSSYVFVLGNTFSYRIDHVAQSPAEKQGTSQAILCNLT